MSIPSEIERESIRYNLGGPLTGAFKLINYLKDHHEHINAPIFNELTPIQLAARRGHVYFVKWVLEHGGDADAMGFPLSSAMLARTPDVLDVLLTHGVNMEYRDDRGETALHQYAACGSLEMLKICMKHNAGHALVDNQQQSAFQLLERHYPLMCSLDFPEIVWLRQVSQQVGRVTKRAVRK